MQINMQINNANTARICGCSAVRLVSWRASGLHKRDKSGLPTALGSPLRPAYVSPATESTTTSAYSLPTSGHNQQQLP